MTTTALDTAHVADLARQVSGSVLGQQDEGYDTARAVYNGLVDRKPALIVRRPRRRTSLRRLRSRGGKDSRSRSAAADTTSPDAL